MKSPVINEERSPLVGAPQRSEGERSETERSEGAPTRGAASPGVLNATVADPEVMAKPARRRFTAEYKLRILREVERCRKPGDIGALLRREGLYSSLLTEWRRQREQGARVALTARKRGRPSKVANPLARKVADLEKENRRLQGRLKQAETIIEFQKKISDLLAIPLKSPESEGGV